MIKDHPMLGKQCNYDDGKRKCTGVVTGVKHGGFITNIETGENKGRAIKLRIKPDDGSRSFWTIGMRDAPQ